MEIDPIFIEELQKDWVGSIQNGDIRTFSHLILSKSLSFLILEPLYQNTYL